MVDLLDMEKGEKQKVARRVLMRLAQKLVYMMITDSQTYKKIRYFDCMILKLVIMS